MEYVNIGRVRPIYKGEHNPELNYEALDVVRSEDGFTSYMAQKAVPAGKALTDEEYWGLLNEVKSDVVQYGSVQTLTGEQQDQARANIGAASDMDVIELKGDLSTNYQNTGIIEPASKINSFELYANILNNTGFKAISGHRYTVVFTKLSSGSDVAIGCVHDGKFYGVTYNRTEIGTFTATDNGTICFYLSNGSTQTIDEMYIFDTTSDDTLQNFINLNLLDSVTMPYGGFAKNLYDDITQLNNIAGYYLKPNMELENFQFGTSTFSETGYHAINGHRYCVIWTELVDATTVVGVISGGAWAGASYNATKIGTFNASGDGIITFYKQTGNSQTINVYIFDTTDNDELQNFLKTYGMESVSTVYHSLISQTWYYGKTFTAFGDSITQQGEWITPLNKKYLFGNIVNCGVGGSSVGGSYANSFWQDARVETIPTSSDLITIMGGTNDSATQRTIGNASRSNIDTNTFIGAMNVLISKILYKFGFGSYYNDIEYSNITKLDTAKKINIMLITCGFCGDTSYSGADFARMEQFAEAMTTVGSLWGLPVCDIYHNAGINPITYTKYLDDAIHPNANGGERIAQVIGGSLYMNMPIL